MAVEVKKLRSKDESNQSQIVVLKSQIKQFDKEKTELINRISLLEEELSTMQLERDKEILYWQQRLSKEQSHYVISLYYMLNLLININRNLLLSHFSVNLNMKEESLKV